MSNVITRRQWAQFVKDDSGNPDWRTIQDLEQLDANASDALALLTPQLNVNRGGTGVTSLTGYAKGNGTTAFVGITLIPVADGGTGRTTFPANDILFGNGTGAIATDDALQYVGAPGQLTIGNAAISNQLTLLAAASGNQPSLFASGIDADISLALSSKGAGAIFLNSGSNGRIMLALANVASSQNYFQIQPNASGGRPAMYAQGIDANIGITFSSKGTGSVILATGVAARTAFEAVDIPTSVNFLRSIPQATGLPPTLRGVGTDANVGLDLSTQGTGTMRGLSGNSARILWQAEDVASSVNFLDFIPAATGQGPELRAAGTDTNIQLRLESKGTGSVRLLTGNGARLTLEALDVASSVNYLLATPSVTTAAPAFQSAGTDTNVGLILGTKGTGTLSLRTGANDRLLLPENSGSGDLYYDFGNTSPSTENTNIRFKNAAGAYGRVLTRNFSTNAVYLGDVDNNSAAAVIRSGGTDRLTINGTTGIATFSADISTTGIIGTTAGGNATAGDVGEYAETKVTTGASVALTSGVAANVATLNLAAGDWDVSFNGGVTGGGTTLLKFYQYGVNSVSATLPGSEQCVTYGDAAAAGSTKFANAGDSRGGQVVRFSSGSAFTVYLVCLASFTTSTCSGYGIVNARRRR